MANKRTLKKEINYVAGELLSECLCNKYLIPGTDAEKVDALMGKIIGIQDDFLCRVGANGDKDPKKVKFITESSVPTSINQRCIFESCGSKCLNK